MKHIDLFAGIGGFSLGFENAGIETVAHVEIDKACQKVLSSHWPNHMVFADVREVGESNLPHADIITFGSPCQDLSIAGKRAGLEGGRSGLFFEAVRIIREIKPKYAVWENVPGALSSNSGRDFQSVLSTLVDRDVPMPRSGRWATAGMVRVGETEAAWRVLDAQYFGVAQRRRRIFLVFCSGEGSASSILFEREGMQWNPPARGEKGENPAHCLTSCATRSGRYDPFGEDYITVMAHGQANAEITEDVTVTPTLSLNHEAPIVFNANRDGVNAGYNLSPTLTHTGDGKKAHGAYQKVSIASSFGIRRLTPTECERLQGFPDGWTDGQADSARYRQLGNAVAVPVVEWIAKRIVMMETESEG